jgi:hypothetical protein
MMIAPPGTPPLMVLGESTNEFNEGGLTVSWKEADEEPRLAVTVTVVVLVTWPIWNAKDENSTAWPAGTVTDAGTGTAVGLLLVSRTTAPPGGAAVLSCTSPNSSSPLNGAGRVKERDTTDGEAELTVKDAVWDHAVTAAVLGLLLPWKDRTRQNLVPDVSDRTSRCAGVIWGMSSSIELKAESRAIWSS